MAETLAKGDRTVGDFARSATASVVTLLLAFAVSGSARADWWSENVEFHGKFNSTVYYNSPSMTHQIHMDQWWNQLELDTDVKLYDDETNALSFHTIIMPTYDAVYDLYPKMWGDRRKDAAFNTQTAVNAKLAKDGKQFPGRGSGIDGNYYDVNQDTGSFFTGKVGQSSNPSLVLDDVIFFGILNSPSASRNASLQGKVGGSSSLQAWQGGARSTEILGGTPATSAFLGSLAAASKGPFFPIHSFGRSDFVVGDRRSNEEDLPVGLNDTDGQLKTRCFDSAHRWCWAREFYFEAKMGDAQLRLGRQQIVWGKTDAFRLQDVVNPIDFGQHNVYPSLEDRRIPTLSADFVYSFGNVGSLEDVSLELVWVWDKFTPVQVGQCGDFWAFAAACEARADFNAHGLLNVSGAKTEERKWTFQNTEPGFRLEWRTPEPSIAWSVSGFWGIQDAPVGRFTNPYSVKNPNPAMMLFLQGLGVPASVIPVFDPFNEASINASSANALATWNALFGPAGGACPDTGTPGHSMNVAKAKCIAGSGLQALGWIWSSSQGVAEYPRTFTLGASMDYQIPNIDTVLRAEAAYDFDREIQNTRKLDGIDHSDVVLASIGLDRSVFIPFLNKDRTAFVSFQTFMQHIMNYDGNNRAGMADYEWNVISTFFIENYWRGDSLVLTNFFAYDWAAHAWITGPKFKWIVNESFYMEVGINLLQGKKAIHNISDICKSGQLDCLGDPTSWTPGNWQLINKNFARYAEGPYWNLESFADTQMEKRDEVWFGATYQF
ncbi:MAG TPA: DUF1302 family protein [Myxococcota bacterium]|nr:DUF1302 family protein [Myxococcota bacterium]